MKKVLSIVLFTAMIISLFVLPTSAAAWNGTDVSKEFKGEGTAENPYLVETPADLAFLAEKVNGGESYAGKYFKQMADLDLGSKEWKPIGDRSALPFSGIYDGNGYKIVNFYQSFQYRFGGLFAYMKAIDGFTPALLNVTLEGKMDTVTRKGDIYSGALLGWVDQSKTDSVLNDNKVLVANCTVDVDMTFDSTGLGNTASVIIAPVFSRTGSVVVYNCVNNGDINAIADGHQITVGGVVAYVVDADVVNCVNNGKITVKLNGAKDIYGGGVVGAVATSLGKCKVENCVNNADLSFNGGNSNYTGGVVGCVSSSAGTSINNCANVASLTSESSSASALPYGGGILGYAARPGVTVTNSYNSGAIATIDENNNNDAPGGIAGVLNHSDPSTCIKDCVTTTETYKGWFNAANTAENCVTKADPAVVAVAVKAINDVIDSTKNVTLNGTVFNFVFPAPPVQPEPPVDPQPPVESGDITVVLALVAILALGGAVVVKKASVR